MKDIYDDGLGPHPCPLCAKEFNTILELVAHAEDEHEVPIMKSDSAWRQKHWEKQ